MLMRPHYLSLALVAVGLAACGRSNRESQETPGHEAPVAEAPVVAEARPAPVCDEAHLDAVRNELQDMCGWSYRAPEIDVPMSPWGGGLLTTPADVLIAVTLEEIRVVQLADLDRPIGETFLDQYPPIPMSDLPRTLAATSRGLPAKDQDRSLPPLRWKLQIARDVPATAVAELLQTLLDAKMPTGVIELETSEGPAAVRDPILHAKLSASWEKVAPDARIAWAKQQLEPFAGACLNFEDTFDATSKVSSGQVCTALSTGLFVTLLDCGCEREAEILTVMYTVVFGTAPPARRSTTMMARISPDAKPRPGATWGSIVAGFEKDEEIALWIAD